MFVNFHTFTPPSSFIRYFIHSFSNIFSLISPSKQLDVIKIAENPLKTKKKTMPSAPTEILSYESRTSIGDKIRKEGVFRNKHLAILFHLALYIYRRGAKCASSHFCVATELLDEIMIIQRKISSAVIWCNLCLQNAVLCKNKTKALRANIILADHLSVCKKK